MPDRRFRVLAIATHPVQYSSPLFRLFARHPQLDFQVAYCTLRGAQPAHDTEFGATVQWDVPLLDGYHWTEISNRGSGDGSFFGLCNSDLRPFIREGKFDAILCYVGYVHASFWIACFAARSSGAAFLFGTDTTTLAPRDSRQWKVTVKKLLWPRLFRLADQVLAPSSGTRDLMLSLGIPEERITLTPFVVDNDWWTEKAAQVDREAVRASWNVSSSEFVVLFCAKLQPWKRPLDLLRAFAKADLPDATLVFAGDGPLRPQLEAESRTLGIQSRTRFLGFVNQSQLPAAYAASNLMVLTSSYEPFAVVVAEAMLCGCPVVASDSVGAARDLIAPVGPELIYPCRDVEALAAILRSFAASPALLGELSRAAHRRMNDWSPAQNISATFDAISRAVARRGRSRSMALGGKA